MQLTVLAQQISYDGHAMTLVEHVNLTLMGGGKKKKRTYLDPKQLFSSNGMEIRSTMTYEN